jgi:hypothetical protein
MDVARVTELIAGFLEEEKAPFALVGGLALHAYGLTRATLDIDWVADIGIQDRLIARMEALGFETLYRSKGFSNHLHPDPAFGRVDFVYVSGNTSRQLFREAKVRLRIGGVEVKVPRPEHLAAMKIHALKNDPGRRFRELADIEQILSLPGIDREEIRQYFEKSGLKDLYEGLQSETGNA